MVDSNKDGLNKGNPNDMISLLAQANMGDLLAGLLVPTSNVRTGLASNVTQVHDVAARIVTVETGGANVLIIAGGVAPAAGQVAITYSTLGIPTLLFQAAVTAYTSVETVNPAGLGAFLAQNHNAT